MPTPINHQDLSLTETHRTQPLRTHQALVHVHSLTKSSSATITCELRKEYTAPDLTYQDFTRHELSVFESGVKKASLFWDVEAFYTGAGEYVGAKSVDSQLIPSSAGSVGVPRPANAILVYAPTLAGYWRFQTLAWSSVTSSTWTVNIGNETVGPDGRTRSVTIKKSATSMLAGNLSVTVSTAEVYYDAMIAMLETVSSERRRDLERALRTARKQRTRKR